MKMNGTVHMQLATSTYIRVKFNLTHFISGSKQVKLTVV